MAIENDRLLIGYTNKLSSIIMKTRMRNIILLGILLALLILSCMRQHKPSDKKVILIDSLFNYCFDNGIFNGAVLIGDHDKIIYKKAFGYANYDKNEPLQINSVFSLASVSKTFTSMAILMLKEQGKLRLNDKLSKFFYDFPNAERITIWHLLTHTSGVPTFSDYGGVFRVDNRPGDFIDGVTNEKVFNYLKTTDSLRFTPGDRFEYSNSGYLLLSMIVAKASGKPFHQFVKDAIFKPLEMNNSYVISEPDLQIESRAFGFTDFYEPDDDNLLITGSGGIFSTVLDLYKWNQGLSSEKLISNKTFREAFINPKLNDGSFARVETDSTFCYGMGWIFRMNDTDSIMWHDGGLNSCTSIFYRDLRKKYTIIILSNKGSNRPIYPIQDELIKLLNGKTFNLPVIPISIKLKNLIESSEIETAIESCRKLKNKEYSKYDFSMRQLDSLGYYYMGKEQLNIAKAVFKLNVKFHPEDANTYDSYAESLMRSNDNENAISFYKKSLELNPENENAKRMIKRIKEGHHNE